MAEVCAGCEVCELATELANERTLTNALREAIELMVCEIDGIDVGFNNGCKGAALMVGERALGIESADQETA